MHNSNNVSDMTIGDFWDIGKYIPFLNKNFFQKNGISHIKINTLKGKNVWNEIKEEFEFSKILK